MQEPLRRLTTILASDVVGYSLLTAQNEERTVRLIRQRFATIKSFVAQHDGRVFNSAGDSLLAEFPSPVEAVRCALEIQEAMKAANSLSEEADRLVLRIGVNLGDVLISGSDLLGDGVNVAARLEGLAAPGGVCVSATVYEQIRGKLLLEAEDLGEKHVKNLPHPIRAFSLIPGKISVTSGSEKPPAATRQALWYGAALVIVVLVAAAALFNLRGQFWLSDETASKPAPPAPPVAAVTPPAGPASAEPRAAMRIPLIAEDVPFLDDLSQDDLRRSYLQSRDSKALAITIHGHYGYATQRIDERTARSEALEACSTSLRRNIPNPAPQQLCFVYAAGNEVVWTTRPPPMPPQPWIPPGRPEPERVDAARIPFQTPATARDTAAYLADPKSKAMVFARGGVMYYSARRSSGNVAARAALQRCGFLSQHACLVYAIDEEVVVRTPVIMRPTDIFLPDDQPNLSAADRQRINANYLASGDWRALAMGRNSRIGIAIRVGNEQLAIDSAIRDCTQAGGIDCTVVAIGGFTVARR